MNTATRTELANILGIEPGTLPRALGERKVMVIGFEGELMRRYPDADKLEILHWCAPPSPLPPPLSPEGVRMGEATYAIADLHGRFDLLVAAYDAISAHAQGKPGTIVHLGDYVDRGPDSRKIVEWLMDDAALPPGWQRICLKGNHEDMMVETLTVAPGQIRWWVGNGGGQTLISYGHAREGVFTPDVVPVDHVRWLRRLPVMHVDQHRVFVHAGVDPTIPLPEQREKDQLWMLYPDGFEGGHGDRHVVHGHHQFAKGPLLFEGRSDLDTFAWFTGRIVVGVFDSETPGGPVEILEVRGDPSPLATPTPENPND